MADVKFIEVVVSLGVPGLALGILYLLYKKFHFQFPTVPKGYVGPIIILFIVTTAAIVLTAIILFKPTPREDQSEDAHDDYQSVEMIGMVKSISNLSPVSNVTITMSGEPNTAPFPVVRFTVMNRSDVKQLITHVRIYIDSMIKSKSPGEARVVRPTAMWQVNLPTQKGIFDYAAKQAIELPVDTPASIDVALVCSEAGKLFHPSDIGSYKIRISFITDRKTEIAYEDWLLL
jgi:hypothetical protein